MVESNDNGYNIEDICKMAIILLATINLIRAQIEIEIYGREVFEEYQDKIYTRYSNDILNCLVLIFINSFSIYRNIYKLVIGMY